MQLKVEERSLRLRVSEAQLQQLLSGSALRLDLRFDGQDLLALEVAIGPEASLQPGAVWRLQLSDTALRAYAQTLPRRDALVVELTGSGGEPLRLEFEVDLRDSARVRGPRKGGTDD